MTNKNPIIASIANAKGGCGKSSITMFLAAALAKQKKKKVLIIDTDSQRTITDIYEAEVEEGEVLVEVEDMRPSKATKYIEKYGNEFDVVLIDIARVTKKLGDEVAAMLLTNCSHVFVPVIGTTADILSTTDFLQLLKEVGKDRKELGMDFYYSCFINRMNRRSENKIAIDYLKESDTKVLKSHINDLKLFTNPTLQSSILDTKEGKQRFSPFFKEVSKLLNIK